MRKNILSHSKFTAFIVTLGLFTLTGCVANQSSNTGDVSGSAAGSNASGTQVEKCSKPLGELSHFKKIGTQIGILT